MAATLQEINAMYGSSDHLMQTSPSYEQGSQDDSNGPKSPLHGFNILKNLTAEKKVRADGQLPKRRGPKPDSKPALTRRQELNRQAQRTHRERKERYIAALEQEVLRLKETFTSVVKERDQIVEENRKLREVLLKHGLNPEHLGFAREPSSSASYSTSYPPASSATSISPPPSNNVIQSRSAEDNGATRSAPPAQQLDYGQTGIDFVLALERPCMDHMQMLCTKAQDSDGEISGHALMASCPPHNHLIQRPDVPYPPKIESTELLSLLDLSSRLPLDGEITPVMAWSMILRHPHLKYFTVSDLSSMSETLKSKVRCYGFGAVLEEFELNDAVANVLASKGETFAIAP